MKKDYIAFEMRITLLAKEDVVTTSDMEKGVQFDSENWGEGGSWMNTANS